MTGYVKSAPKKICKAFPFTGDWLRVFGEPSTSGMWLIRGGEKNGKTTFALMLANQISNFVKVLYVSGEEGISKHFVYTIKRLGLDVKNKSLTVIEYVSISELLAALKNGHPAKVIFIDNLTVYNDELKGDKLSALRNDYPNKLFVLLAHEEAKQPYTSSAKLCYKLSNINIRVEGLTAFVIGSCPGGAIIIEEKSAQLYWGVEQLKTWCIPVKTFE